MKTDGTFILNNCKVQVDCNAKIHAFETDIVQANDATFEPVDGDCGIPWGYDEMAGLFAENTKWAHFDRCDFSNLRTGFSSKSTVNFATLTDCKFMGCKAGVDLRKSRLASLIRAEGDNTAFRFTDMSVGANLFDCDFDKGFNNEIVYLEDVKLLWMRSGLIECGPSDHHLGINAVNGRNNIMMEKGATIQNGFYGIEMTGGVFTQTGSDWGKLTMDCARILDCQNAAVRGTDILLNIDAGIHSDGGRPNDFRLGNFPGYDNLFFDICYESRQPSNPIPAEYNFWNLFQNGSSVPPSTSDYRLIDTDWQHDCSDGDAVELDVLPVGLWYNPNCPVREEEEKAASAKRPGSEPGCLIGAENIFAHYRSAWDSLVAAYDRVSESGEIPAHPSAMLDFQEIANVDSLTLLTAEPLCKHFVDVGRIFVSPETGGVKPSGKNRNDLNGHDGGSFPAKILPNPASGGFEIQVPEGIWEIEVRDVFGELVLTGKTNSGQ